MAIKLNVGKVAFPIEFDNGDKDVIYFNPKDPDLATRLIASKDKIQKRMEEMNFDDVELNNSGEPVNVETLSEVSDLSDEQTQSIVENAEKVVAIVNKTKTIICEELDDAFKSDISSVIFKYCSPFAVVDGQYFIIQFLDAVAEEVKKYAEDKSESQKKRVNKHINKYRR